MSTPINWSEVIASNIKAAREAAGLTQAALAERTGIVYSVVSRLEAGLRLPTVETLIRLADALGVEPAELLRRQHPTRRLSKKEKI